MRRVVLYAAYTLILSLITAVNIIAQQYEEISPQNTIAIEEEDSKETIIWKAAHVVPTDNQYQALKNEFIAFIHFGPNTFTRMEWGNGFEDPKIFDLETLDTDQWCKVMKEAGMKMVIITVKHHDGFVLWQSRYTSHGIMDSPYKDGKGDVLKELSESCAKYDLKLGVYLSPADLFQIENEKGLYGNLSEYTMRTIPRSVENRPFKNKKTFSFLVDDYNEYFLNQLFELLTEYGPIHEVWFDGAHPKRKGGQTYHYLAWKELIRALAPEAVIFGKEDIRWCGNESGGTRKTEMNVIPYQDNPGEMNSFGDLTEEDLSSREKLYDANFLHYQQAETNTSIREGWFYRDDEKQKVRNSDDVFDIYERAVGGNSTFLLNIPPNRNGKFSDEDVSVLKEVGERIRNTYGNNLFVKASGPLEVLDGIDETALSLTESMKDIVITLDESVTINRLVLQEAITTHSERVEKHVLDVWTGNEWKEIAGATNIGYKRILRFPEVTASKFRIRVTKSRANPAIASISAHYYKTRPPQLEINRDLKGKVSIVPVKHEFSWKPHGEDAALNLNQGSKIYFTLDGSEPNRNSNLYEGSFKYQLGTIKAVSIIDEMMGNSVSAQFGPVKSEWKVISVSGEKPDRPGNYVCDANKNTFWQSEPSSEKSHFIAIDLGSEYAINTFSYTPQKEHAEGMIEKGTIQVSKDGVNWDVIDSFEFGNLINDPSTRTHELKSTLNTKFIRIEATSIAGDGKTAAIAEIDFYLN